MKGRACLYRLSERELAVLRLLAQGLSSKQVGSELSIADSTVRGATLRAVTKLSLSSASQVPLFWHTLKSPCAALQVTNREESLLFESNLELLHFGALSASERDLAQHVLMGHANPEIARRRGVSPRTVANQLHAMFGKLAVSSRGELAASLLR